MPACVAEIWQLDLLGELHHWTEGEEENKIKLPNGIDVLRGIKLYRVGNEPWLMLQEKRDKMQYQKFEPAFQDVP